MDRTSLPAQHATKTNGLAYIHRSGQMLSLQISYSLSLFSLLVKNVKGKRSIKSFIFVFRKKGSKTKKRMKEEEVERRWSGDVSG